MRLSGRVKMSDYGMCTSCSGRIQRVVNVSELVAAENMSESGLQEKEAACELAAMEAGDIKTANWTALRSQNTRASCQGAFLENLGAFLML